MTGANLEFGHFRICDGEFQDDCSVLLVIWPFLKIGQTPVAFSERFITSPFHRFTAHPSRELLLEIFYGEGFWQ